MPLPSQPKKKGRKQVFKLSEEDEEIMVTFVEENPMIWNKKLADYKRAAKKCHLWEKQAEKMGKTPDYLIGLHKGLCDGWVRIDKNMKSGTAPYEPTECQLWMRRSFHFLERVASHRPQPVTSLSIDYILLHIFTFSV